MFEKFKIPKFERKRESQYSKHKRIRSLQIQVNDINQWTKENENQILKLCSIFQNLHESIKFEYNCDILSITIKNDDPFIENLVLLYNLISFLFDQIDENILKELKFKEYVIERFEFILILFNTLLKQFKENDSVNKIFQNYCNYCYNIISSIYYEYMGFISTYYEEKSSFYKTASVFLENAVPFSNCSDIKYPINERKLYLEIKILESYAFHQQELNDYNTCQAILQLSIDIFNQSQQSFKDKYFYLFQEIQGHLNNNFNNQIYSIYQAANIINQIKKAPAQYQIIETFSFDSFKTGKRTELYEIERAAYNAIKTNNNGAEAISKLVLWTEKLDSLRKIKNAQLYSGCYPKKQDVNNVKEIEKLLNEVSMFIKFVQSTSFFIKTPTELNNQLNEIIKQIQDDINPQIDLIGDDEIQKIIEKKTNEINNLTIARSLNQEIEENIQKIYSMIQDNT